MLIGFVTVIRGLRRPKKWPNISQQLNVLEAGDLRTTLVEDNYKQTLAQYIQFRLLCLRKY